MIAYVPCTEDIADASGQSTVTVHNGPSVSSSPAGARGGASCSLGSVGILGTGRGFTVALPSALGAGDFTVELSIYQTEWHDPADVASQVLITTSTYPGYGAVTFPSFWSGVGQAGMRFDGGGTYLDAGASLGKWADFAASRVSGTTYLFRDGELLTSFPDARDYTDASFDVSYQMNGAYNAVIGSMGHIRITKVGRYTSAYETCAGAFSTSK